MSFCRAGGSSVESVWLALLGSHLNIVKPETDIKGIDKAGVYLRGSGRLHRGAPQNAGVRSHAVRMVLQACQQLREVPAAHRVMLTTGQPRQGKHRRTAAHLLKMHCMAAQKAASCSVAGKSLHSSELG